VKSIPHNIYSIANIDQWRETFSFPLSATVCPKLHVKMSSFLFEAYNEFPDELRVHYRIATKHIYSDTLQLLMRLTMAESMRQTAAARFVLTNHRCPAHFSLGRNMTFDLYLGKDEVVFDAFEETVRQSSCLRRRPHPLLKYLLKRLKGHNVVPLEKADYVTVDPNSTVDTWIGKRPAAAIDFEDVFKRHGDLTPSEKQRRPFAHLADRLQDFIVSEFDAITGGSVSERVLSQYRDMLYAYFGLIAQHLEQARVFFDHVHLRQGITFCTGTAKHLVRVISEAARERGARVIGFPHNGGDSHTSLPALPFAEFACCDAFACFDEHERGGLRTYRTLEPVDFEVIEQVCQSVWETDEQWIDRPLAIDLNRVETIMFPGAAYFYDNPILTVPADTVLFDLDLKILEFLLSLKRRVVYKVRGKTQYLHNGFNHFNYFKDRVVYDDTPFRKVMQTADLLVFNVFSSSALCEAMTFTHKPIVLFYSGHPRPTAGFERVLGKRCYIVNLQEDGRNRLCFDQQKAEALFAW